MIEFFSNFISGIQFFFVSQIEISQTKKGMETSFAEARRVPGTRSFHQFIPLPQGKLARKKHQLIKTLKQNSVLLESQSKMKKSKKSSMLDVFWCVHMMTFFGLIFKVN